MVGKIISHYKILEKLGEGGMGVVYKAEDTKLKRIVALKFLPHHLSISNEDNARLLNEAQMTAKLNHPHICTIYDIEEADEEKFIVMEFVDGVTLRTKMKETVLRFEEAINYATQIGEALEEAHAQGIIHRDIKPDNIMINSKNQIKVMDFGIAKLKEGLGVTRTMSTSGTLSYMAPEQLSNSAIDGRVDIFSLGILLYEMLSSKLPFRGDHQAAMIYSILNEEPEPINKYLSEVPSEMLHVLNRALEKDPEDRYQNVHDMVIDLRRLKKQTGGVTHHTTTHEHFENITEPTTKSFGFLRSKSKKQLAVILLFVLLIVCAVVAVLFISRGPQLNPDMKSQVITLPFQSVRYATMSKDGNWVVFPAADDKGKFDIYMMNLSQGQPRKVTNDFSVSIPNATISPDANTILFTRYNYNTNLNEIISVSSSGGSERVILENATVADWRTDGQRILFLIRKLITYNRRVLECWSSKPDGLDRRFEFADTFANRIGYRNAFNYSSDGRSIVWTKNFKEGYCELMIRDLEKGTDRQLTFDKKFADDPIWAPNDQIIYSSNRNGNINLWIISASGGEAAQLTRGSGHDMRMGITSDGKRLLYSEIHENIGQIKLGNLNNGSIQQLTFDDRARANPSFSPDGKEIVFIAQELDDISYIRNIYVMNKDGSNVRKLTDDVSFKNYPTWSADKKWIIYAARPTNEPLDSMRVYLIQADKPGPPRMVGYGFGPLWFNEKEFTFVKLSLTTYKGSVDSKEVQRFSEDSIVVRPILNGKYVSIGDNRTAQKRLYTNSMTSYKLSGIKNAKPLYLFRDLIYSFIASTTEFYYRRKGSENELRKITFPDLSDLQVNFDFNGLAPTYDFNLSNDGKEIVYVQSYWKVKYIILDNIFK
ncbi:MAG: protein kinase [Ignavibacteriales bacterium]|nr:protein kinase [Ignavibacteriales bacterium]